MWWGLLGAGGASPWHLAGGKERCRHPGRRARERGCSQGPSPGASGRSGKGQVAEGPRGHGLQAGTRLFHGMSVSQAGKTKKQEGKAREASGSTWSSWRPAKHGFTWSSGLPTPLPPGRPWPGALCAGLAGGPSCWGPDPALELSPQRFLTQVVSRGTPERGGHSPEPQGRRRVGIFWAPDFRPWPEPTTAGDGRPLQRSLGGARGHPICPAGASGVHNLASTRCISFAPWASVATSMKWGQVLRPYMEAWSFCCKEAIGRQRFPSLPSLVRPS